ncbi:hypothetical protein CVS40_12937 [Lucilia cuprina]|nr:hypothetical protein CVS40_12937 [Lucilia cuprina]
MSPLHRQHLVKRHYYCLNCLARSHSLRSCTSRDTCRKCKKMHHTLLHPTQRNQRSSSNRNNRQQPNRQQPKSHQPPTTSTIQQASHISPTPDAIIIVEAIKSLAQVLSALLNVAILQGRRHVQTTFEHFIIYTYN